jgi:Flp pilus assembly protein TadG
MRLPVTRFTANARGNFAIVSALLMAPLIIGAGLAVDITSMNRAKAALQQAMDSASLAIAREGDGVSDAEAEKIAREFVATNFDGKTSRIAVKRDGTAVTVSAATNVKLSFAGLLGYTDAAVRASSTADIAYVSYEIGLVLDTTGSMAGGKLQAMKDAVLGLIDTMSAQVPDKDQLKFALVPFSAFVNIGDRFSPTFDALGNQRGDGANWLDMKGLADIPQVEFRKGTSRFEVFHHIGQKWAGCVESRVASGGKNYDAEDIAPDPSKPDTLFEPAFAIDEGDTGGYKNNYIASNVDPLDKSLLGLIKKMLKYGVNLNPLGIPLSINLWGAPPKMDLSGGKGPNAGCGTQPIMALSDDYKTLKDNVNALQASGNTNIMEGVAWGTRVLSPKPPFTEGLDPAVEKHPVKKIMIVLTDGSNTFGNNGTGLGSAYSSFGYLVDGRLGTTTGNASVTNSLMNAKTLDACDNAKSEGIELYTIRLEEPNVKTGMMLKDCATDAAHFFDAPSRNDLDAVFKAIKTSITKVRLAS